MAGEGGESGILHRMLRRTLGAIAGTTVFPQEAVPETTPFDRSGNSPGQ